MQLLAVSLVVIYRGLQVSSFLRDSLQHDYLQLTLSPARPPRQKLVKLAHRLIKRLQIARLVNALYAANMQPLERGVLVYAGHALLLLSSSICS